MKLVSISDYWWGKYQELCEYRKAPVPWPVRTCLFVAEGKELVAGVLIYDTNGPHVFFEHLVTNETASLKARHEAVWMMAEEMVRHCRTIGKIPHILVAHKGIERVLSRVGLKRSGAWSITCTAEALSA